MAQVRNVRRSSLLAIPASVRLFLQRLRVEGQLALVLIVVVLVTAALFASIPRFYNRTLDEGLAYALRSAGPALANVQLLQQTPLQLGGEDPAATISSHGDTLQAELPANLSGLFGHTDFVVQSAEYQVQLGTDAPAWPQYFIKTRFQSGIDGHLRIAEGRMPAATSETVPIPTPIVDPETGKPTGKVRYAPAPVVEVAISSDAAQTADMRVGDRLKSTLNEMPRFVQLGPDGQLLPGIVYYDIVGRFDVADPEADYWYDDVLMQRANVAGTVDHPMIHVIGLVAPAG
ncbi:MAG TPA: hypothetical protein VFX74_03970 [Candidatus Limnocylindria bacterium]|nr:hypothetical protein [Candidatus Limnocylindria bacterium]